ncbi:MAG: tetratricopeptide repeat protein [bacterium]
MKSTKKGFAGVAKDETMATACAIFFVALGIRVIHILEMIKNPFFYHPIVDAWDYHKDAVAIVTTGDWIGRYPFFQAPLITYFLALIYKIGGVNLLLPRIVQAIIGSFSVAGTFLLANVFDKRIALLAGTIACFYPIFLFFETEILPPTITIALDVLFFLSVFYYAIPTSFNKSTEEYHHDGKPDVTRRSPLRWLIPGAIFGLRSLATTNNLAAIPVIWVWIILVGRKSKIISLSGSATKDSQPLPSAAPSLSLAIKPIVFFTLGVALTLAPVTIRNSILSKKFVVVSTNAGINFYIGNSGDYEKKVGLRPGAEWDEFVEKNVLKGKKVGAEMSSYFISESIAYIKQNPRDYFRLLVHKTRLLLHGNEIMRNQEIYPFRKYSPFLKFLLWKVPGKIGIAFPFGILLPISLIGFLLAIYQKNYFGCLLGSYSLIYGASIIAFFVTARYRAPIVMPLIILSAYGLVNWKEWWHDRALRLLILSGVIILFVISNSEVSPSPRDMNPDAYYSLADTHYEQGEIEKAEHYYRKALLLDPNNASAWINLGLQVYETRGEMDLAQDCYENALQVKPGFSVALHNLGRIAEMRNSYDEADLFYSRAISANPLMIPSYINLGYLRLRQKKVESAYQLFRGAYELDPENPTSLIGLAIAEFELGRISDAIKSLRKAETMDPDNPDIHFNLSLFLSRSGRHYEAAQAARRAIEINPHDEQAYSIFIDQMILANRVAEARQFLESIQANHPGLTAPAIAIKNLQSKTESREK